jgi:hypothetical protein
MSHEECEESCEQHSLEPGFNLHGLQEGNYGLTLQHDLPPGLILQGSHAGC